MDSIDFDSEYDFLEIDSSQTNIWQIAPPQKAYLDSALSDPNVMITDSIANYPVSNYSSFDLYVTNEFDAGYVFVGFNHKYDSDTLRDGMYITYSYDSGDTWSNVLDYMLELEFSGGAGSSKMNLYGEPDTLYNGENGFSGRSDEWELTMFGWFFYPISPNRGGGNSGSGILRFNFLSDSLDNNREGWMIDDMFTFSVQLPGGTTDRNRVQFKLFPNPASNRIMVETENNYQELKMEIRSITAKETIHVSSGSGNRIEADGIDLETGVYLVAVYGDDEFLGTARCVMQR